MVWQNEMCINMCHSESNGTTCLTTLEDCIEQEKQTEANLICISESIQTNCASCTFAHEYCGWNTLTTECVMYLNYNSIGELVIAKDQCPGKTTILAL